MDTARHRGILCSGSGSATREEGLQPREINELSVWRMENDRELAEVTFWADLGSVEQFVFQRLRLGCGNGVSCMSCMKHRDL